MKIVLLSILLLCGQLLFANFSPPASAPHLLIYFQSIDNQLQANFKTPLLPIEPAKPLKNSEPLLDPNPLLTAPLFLLIGIIGMVAFGLGLSYGILWLWVAGLGLESLIVLLGLIFGILGAYESAKPVSGEWVHLGPFYQFYFLSLLLFFIPKSIQLFVLAASLAMPLLTAMGFASLGFSLVLLIITIISLALA